MTKPAIPLREIGPGLPMLTRTRRQTQDTVAGCRERAAANLTEAATLDVANGRWKLEHSAAAWTSRADLLERLEAKHDARVAGRDAQA